MNFDRPLGQRKDTPAAKLAEYATDVNRRQSDRIGDVPLLQRERVALPTDPITSRDAAHQMLDEVCNTLFGRTPAEYVEVFGAVADLIDEDS